MVNIGYWPFPCLLCGQQAYVARVADREQDESIIHIVCPCGYRNTLKSVPYQSEADFYPLDMTIEQTAAYQESNKAGRTVEDLIPMIEGLYKALKGVVVTVAQIERSLLQ